MAVDRYSLNKIHEYRGLCLYCPESPERYDLEFCYKREVWVLYARLSSFKRAMALAQTVQWQGASHIIVLRVHGILFEECNMSQIPEAVIELPSWEQPAAWNEPILFEPLGYPGNTDTLAAGCAG